MRLRHFILASLAALVAFVSCENEEENLGLPTIKLDGDGTMTFEAAGGDQQITLTATRDWWVECDAEWLDILPEEGKASADAQTITVTAKTNTGMDRTADVKFTIGMSHKTLTVTQAGPGGSAEDLIVYANDFDKEEAVKGSSWTTYLDTFQGWHNERGSGKATVTYGFQKMTARTNSANGSGGQHSLYTELGASGVNYLWFGTAPTWFAVKNISLPEGKTDYTISFGTERYEYSETETVDNTFNWNEFSAYVSVDAQKWVKLSCDFAGGSLPVGKWDLASSTFTVPAGTQKLHVYFTTTKGSAYAIDDLKLVQAATSGTALDFANGEVFEVNDSDTGDDNGGGNENIPEGTGEGTLSSPYSASKAWHVASALGSSDTAPGVYVQGIVKEIEELSTEYGNATYYITDEDGIVNFYIYRGKYLNEQKFTSAEQITVGDNVVVYGDMMNYKGNSPQLGQGNYLVKLNDLEGTTPGTAPESKGEKTVAGFIETADAENFYTLTGTVSNFNSQYFSFDLTDETGTIYVYSVSSASKAQWAETVSNGSVVTLIGKYMWYENTDDASKNKHEVTEAWIVTATQGEDTEENPVEPGEYDPQGITWTLGSSAYDKTSGQNAQHGTVNGVSVANLLKLGTGSKVGDATLHVPAGTEKIGFYAVAWKGMTAEVKFSINGTELTTIKPSANDGATGNPPYTITVTDDDYFVIEMPSADAADVKVETLDPNNGRVIFIKLEANPDKEAGDTPGEGGEDPEPPVVEETLMTIAEVLASTSALPEGSYIEAVVISDRTLNNLTSKKGLYVQDATGGLQFYLAANHELNFGDKVKINLAGQKLADYNGAVQVSDLALDKITTVSTGNAVEPKTVTVADFLANKYEGQYIAIEGVQVAESDLAKTFVEGTGDNAKHTSINVETADGKTFVIFSSKYASYGAETVPQGSGTIKGISSISKGTMQLIFAQASDYAGLTGERFDGNAGGGDSDPEPAVSTVAEVLKSSKGDAVSTAGTVMAIHQKGYVLGDATGAIYVYTASAPAVAVGNNVTLSGTFDNYFGTLQIKDATVSSNDNSTSAPSYPELVDLTDQTAYDAFKTYSDSSPVDFPYVKIKGVLSDGRYITVGTSEKQSMLDWSNGDYSSYNDKTVIVTAYIKGFHSTDGYYQIIETSVVVDESADGGDEGDEVTPPAGGASYVKVTEAPADWTGRYLIVYENGTDAYVFNGADAVNGYVSAAISSNTIAASSDLTTYEVAVETMDGGYALKIGGQYMSGTNDANKLNLGSTQSLNTLTVEEDGVKVESNTSVLRFNATSNQMRFRYYKASTYAGQKPVQLYKYTE